MALLLSEADVRMILTMPIALKGVEDSFRRLGDGSGVSHPRRRLPMVGKGFMHYMAAADAAASYMGLKIYTASPKGARFIVPLFHSESGDLVALIKAYLGQMRTGAASGVATAILAREDARTAAIIGTGLQARTQLEAVAAVRKLTSIRAFGRDPERREQFAKEMTARLGLTVAAAASAEEAVRGADILITSTNSITAVVEGGWLERGVHINAIGVNWAHRRELDDTEAVRRCDLIAADSVEQSKIESGDLIQAFGDDASRWDGVREMADIVSGKAAGRTDRSQITLFKSNGIAIEDIVIAGRIYEAAKERKMGREVPMWDK